MSHAETTDAQAATAEGDAIRPMMLKICVVSDDLKFHATVRDTLAPMGIWDVSAFASFQDARTRAGARAYDLIIVDCPKIVSLATNFIAERRTGANAAFADAQVLAVMGSITRGVLAHLRQCGADSVMLRPLRAGALSVRVRRLLGLRKEAIEDRLAA